MNSFVERLSNKAIIYFYASHFNPEPKNITELLKPKLKKKKKCSFTIDLTEAQFTYNEMQHFKCTLGWVLTNACVRVTVTEIKVRNTSTTPDRRPLWPRPGHSAPSLTPGRHRLLPVPTDCGFHDPPHPSASAQRAGLKTRLLRGRRRFAFDHH